MIPQFLLPESNSGVPLDNYYRFPKALSDEVIEGVHRLGESLNMDDAVAGGKVNPAYRRAKVGWIYRTNESQWLYQAIAEWAQNSNQNMWHLDITSLTESVQYGRYDSEDKGHYEMHMDLGASMPNRKLSICVQLDQPGEDYEGGEFEFQTGKEVFTPVFEKGDVIVFPSFHLHRVKPVTAGVRRSLVTWVHGPVWK